MPKTPVIPVKLTDIREKDEYIAEAERIADEHKLAAKKEKLRARLAAEETGPVADIRQKILMMSLFPNVFLRPQPHRTFGKKLKTSGAEGDYLRRVTGDIVPGSI